MAAFTNTEVLLKIGGAVGSIYTHDNATSQAVANGASYVKLLNYTGNGIARLTTPDYTSGKITLTQPGVYDVDVSFSFTGSGAGVNWYGAVFQDGVEVSRIHFQRKLGTAGDYGSASFSGMLVVGETDSEIDLRVRHGAGTSQNITVAYCNLRVGLCAINDEEVS